MTNTAIRVENLGKRYQLGVSKSGSFRESMSSLFRRSSPPRRSENHPVSGHAESQPDASIQYLANQQDFWALQDINFEIKRGEAVGIIGRNGAGKSTLLKILSRITEPTKGRFEIFGRVSSLLEVGTGFHPELTGRENVYLNGTILGMKRREVKAKFDEIVAFSGVEKFIDTPVKHYSSGMQVRLAFAVAAHLEPEILIIDEVLAVGDAEFQKKCLGKMEDVTGEGRTVLFVSHNMGAVQALCNRGVLLKSGRIDTQGVTTEVLEKYLAGNEEKNSNIEMSTNRSGNQKIIFSEFLMENLQGDKIITALSGQDVVFVFKIRVNQPCSTINIGFSIHNHLGDNLSVLYSGYQSTYFSFNEKGYQNVKCVVKSISLSAGKYAIQGRIEENGVEADWPKERLGYIEIEMGDYYGTGSIGFSGSVPLLVKGEWQ